MFSVCYSITKDFFKKDLENTVSLIINHSRNTLNIITTHKMMNSKLNNICDVVSKNLVIMLNITFNNIYDVISKNLAVMFNIILNNADNVVSKILQ